MAYDLEEFCSDLAATIKAKGVAGISDVAGKLQRLLANPEFVARTFDEDTPPGKRELFHDSETGTYVLAHVQAPGKRGNPHSHGDSWAIYGNARGYTDMTEWTRVNSEDADHAELALRDSYRLNAGQTRAYGPGTIHATEHKEKAWVIRVTGCDLDVIPRFRFRNFKDRIVEQAAAE
jgi:predicted metal-dependent enzyme (double-stranded beta helix superfamily)